MFTLTPKNAMPLTDFPEKARGHSQQPETKRTCFALNLVISSWLHQVLAEMLPERGLGAHLRTS